MARGTWQGSGTWRTTGGGGAGIAVAVLILLAIGSGAMSAVASALAVILIVVAVCLALAVAVVVVLIWRRGGRGTATWTPAMPAGADREAVTATVTPQVTHASTPPVIENHYHVHHHYAAAPEPARIITAIPGQAGKITEEGTAP